MAVAYAGVDPVTNRQLYLTEVIEPGPRVAALAEKARTRLLNQVDERRHPRTRLLVEQLPGGTSGDDVP